MTVHIQENFLRQIGCRIPIAREAKTPKRNSLIMTFEENVDPLVPGPASLGSELRDEFLVRESFHRCDYSAARLLGQLIKLNGTEIVK